MSTRTNRETGEWIFWTTALLIVLGIFWELSKLSEEYEALITASQ